MNDRALFTGALALVTGGIASAFSLAACCAIPLFLTGAGLSAGWLAPIVSASQPHAEILTGGSFFALIGSVATVWATRRSCTPGSICARPGFRWAITGAAAAGAILLALSKIYA
jgi:mercuric ion transport protein